MKTDSSGQLVTRNRIALGRGLQSLIPSPTQLTANSAQQGLKYISIDELLPGDGQPRHVFDDAALDELASSISEHGVLQPLIVRQRAGGQYEIVAGERRWRAARRANLATVPCVIMDLADEKVLTVALVENIQREDLNAIEEAESFRRLSENLGYTQEQIAKAIGKDRTTITNALRLLKLPKEAQQLVVDRQLTMGHARALLSLSEPSLIQEYALQIVQQGLSVRQTEELVQDVLEKSMLLPSEDAPQKPQGISKESSEQRELRKKLEEYFGTRVGLHQKKGRGKIVVHFTSLEQLNSILGRIQISL